MLRAALGFFIIALVCALFGAYGIAGVSMDFGRLLLVVFMVLALGSFVGGLLTNRTPPRIP